jgi:hypothetical protein
VAEGAVLVPFWRSLRPEAFLAWYAAHAGLLLRFFGPLEVAGAALAIAALVLRWLAGAGGLALLGASALLAVAVLAAFPLYFQRTNASFAAGTLAPDRVAGELRRWAAWHWARCGIAAGAFAAAVLALRGPGS